MFLPFIAQNFPQLVETYRQRYEKDAYLPASYGKRISALVRNLSAKYGMKADERWRAVINQPEAARQMDLF